MNNLNNNVSILDILNKTNEVTTTINESTINSQYKVSNVIKFGNVIDNCGVLSNFTDTQYAKLPFDIALKDADSWELCIAFKLFSLPIPNVSAIIPFGYHEAGANRYKAPQIAIDSNANKVRLCLSSNGTSWDIFNDTPLNNYVPEINTEYIVKIIYENNTYKFNVSNSTNYIIDEITVNSELKAYGIENGSLGMGGATTELQPIDGSINLNKSYIKVNNEYVWKGVDTVADLHSNALAVLTGNCGNTFNASNLTGESIDVTSYFGTSGSYITKVGTYTAPADGILQWGLDFSVNSHNNRWFVPCNNTIQFANNGYNLYNGRNYPYIALKKGQVGSFHWCTEYPNTLKLVNAKFWYVQPNNLIFETLYPIGSIYIGTMQVCPLQLLGVGTWQLVGQDKVLQGAGTRGNVGTELDESLPNIKGSIGGYIPTAYKCTGAFTGGIDPDNRNVSKVIQDINDRSAYIFDVSKYSSTYQDNAPVQQDAYLVNIWERIA